MIQLYQVSVIQASTQCVTDQASKVEVIARNTTRALQMIDYVCKEPRYPSKLVAFPEFFLTSVPESRRHEDFMMLAIEVPGEFTEPFARKAREHGCYVVGHSFEVDPDWPGRCFSTAWLMDPRGQIVLKYRKHNYVQIFLTTTTNPNDIMDEYLERSGGLRGLFPVVDTELGRLACIVGYDITFPEVARALALHGAEVLVHVTGEGYSFAEMMRTFRRARACENTCYVLCANHGEFLGDPRPHHLQRGYSEVIDFDGRTVAVVDGPGETTLTVPLDIESLRRRRATAGFFNFLPELRTQLYARVYQQAEAWPENRWRDRSIAHIDEARAVKSEVLERFYQSGVFARPAGE